MARYALRNPWWSLSDFAATKAASELQGSASQVHWQLSEAATAASTAQVTGFNYKEPKTEQEVSWARPEDIVDEIMVPAWSWQLMCAVGDWLYHTTLAGLSCSAQCVHSVTNSVMCSVMAV